ncbi:Eukaryotic translation initiation factor 5B [Camellia lanceoleosa]|uniref:Eukaryotic translation initiation factor 5B n=1 Tax=Camellia lanceoleosa TaxID=1840588 RepID=A0ACC0GPF7_9ERIC|nr:Eukaryotic translation initiation factor 5B [Camellia lanceoleosa]
MLNQSEIDLQSPICYITGHVDTSTTKLLDCICGTNVQEGEAGGITQQIGATYFPAQNIRERTKELKADAKLNVPGLLVIDTPGHESFTNLRSRGSVCQRAPIVKAMKQQSKDVQIEFNTKPTKVITQSKEQGLKTELYYRYKEMGETYSIVPTSAISGEGIPDLLLLLVQWTQKTMIEKLVYCNEVQGTCLHHKEIKAAQGIKIPAQGLELAIAGTALYVVGPYGDSEDIKEAAMEDMKYIRNVIGILGIGFEVSVVLQAQIHVGNPICIPQREFIDIGRIASIGNNRKPVHYAKKGQKVAIK